MTAADIITQKLADLPPVDATIIGTFVQQVGALAVVNVGDAQITVPNIGSTVPYPSQPVRLLRIGKQTFLWGPATPGWPIGQVVSASAPRAVVEYPPGSGVTMSLGYPTSMTLVAGNYVLIDWTSGGLIVAGPYSLLALPEVVSPGSPSGSTGAVHRDVFTAIDSGSYRSGWWTNLVYDSDNNDGAVFYGSKINDTIPDAAVINSISIYLPIQSSSGSNPQLQLHTSAYKPGGTVSFAGTPIDLTTRSGWVPLATAYGDVLKSGYYGFGFPAGTGGFNIYSGVGTDGLAFALDITYTS